jgi:hypothetical protein
MRAHVFQQRHKQITQNKTNKLFQNYHTMDSNNNQNQVNQAQQQPSAELAGGPELIAAAQGEYDQQDEEAATALTTNNNQTQTTATNASTTTKGGSDDGAAAAAANNNNNAQLTSSHSLPVQANDVYDQQEVLSIDEFESRRKDYLENTGVKGQAGGSISEATKFDGNSMNSL